jgi:hypothetical protein
MLRLLGVLLVLTSVTGAVNMGEQIVKAEYVLGTYGVFDVLRTYHDFWSITGDADTTEVVAQGLLRFTAADLEVDSDSAGTLTFLCPVVFESTVTTGGSLGVTDTITVLGADTTPLDLIFVNGLLVDTD